MGAATHPMLMHAPRTPPLTSQYAAAVKFFDQVAQVAEQEAHHPDLHLTDYREVKVTVIFYKAVAQ